MGPDEENPDAPCVSDRVEMLLLTGLHRDIVRLFSHESMDVRRSAARVVANVSWAKFGVLQRFSSEVENLPSLLVKASCEGEAFESSFCIFIENFLTVDESNTKDKEGAKSTAALLYNAAVFNRLVKIADAGTSGVTKSQAIRAIFRFVCLSDEYLLKLGTFFFCITATSHREFDFLQMSVPCADRSRVP